MQTHLFSRRPIVLSMQDIDSLTKDSPISLLNALYQCQDFIFVDSKNNASLSESNIAQTFGYKSSFYLSFIANKDSLNENYLNARKALYKSFQQIKQEQIEELQGKQQELELELQGLDSKQRESKPKELQREQEIALREKQRQEMFFNKNTSNKDSKLILESKDKSNVIIFLDTLESNSKKSYFVSESSVVNSPQISTSFQNLAFQILWKFQNLTHTNTESAPSVIASISNAKSKQSTEKTNITIESKLDLKTMDCHRTIESCNDDKLDSKKLDCCDFTSVKSRNDKYLKSQIDSKDTDSNRVVAPCNDDKIDSNPFQILETLPLWVGEGFGVHFKNLVSFILKFDSVKSNIFDFKLSLENMESFYVILARHKFQKGLSFLNFLGCPFRIHIVIYLQYIY